LGQLTEDRPVVWKSGWIPEPRSWGAVGGRKPAQTQLHTAGQRSVTLLVSVLTVLSHPETKRELSSDK
jgi:hypothetical protein